MPCLKVPQNISPSPTDSTDTWSLFFWSILLRTGGRADSGRRLKTTSGVVAEAQEQMADAARYPKTGAPAAAPRSSDAFAEGDDIVDMMAGISIEASSSSPPEASDGEPESAVLNDGEADSSGFIPAKIFVGGLSWCTDEDHLRLHFEKCVYMM